MPLCAGLHLCGIVDGVPEMLKAVRDELRKGADHIKLMVSGGVASPHDPLESLQFRIDEIEAACRKRTTGANMSPPTPTPPRRSSAPWGQASAPSSMAT